MKVLIYPFLFLALILGSCSSLKRYQLKFPEKGKDEIERRIERSYQLGKIKTTFVGDEIIKVKDYYLSKTEEARVAPSDNFVISGKNVNGTGLKITLSGEVNDSYDISGLINYNNQDVYVVKIPCADEHSEQVNKYYCDFCALISQSGKFLNRVIARGYVQPGNLSIEPNGVVFQKVTSERVNYIKGYLNQELVYSGKNGNEIKITYREYTEDGLAKPAFYQDLTYDLRESIIRFKKFKLELLKASNEQIEFRVLEDGIN